MGIHVSLPGDITPANFGLELQSGYWIADNNPNCLMDIGFREWSVSLVRNDGSIIAVEEFTDDNIQPYLFNYTEDKLSLSSEYNWEGIESHLMTYIKIKLFSGVSEIIAELLPLYNDKLEVRLVDDFSPAVLSFRLHYDDNKSRGDNHRLFDKLINQIKAFLTLLKEIKVHLTIPTGMDKLTLRFHNPTFDEQGEAGIYVPFPLYFSITDVKGEYRQKLTAEYETIEGIPYRVYQSKGSVLGHVILDVLNILHHQNTSTFLMEMNNPQES